MCFQNGNEAIRTITNTTPKMVDILNGSLGVGAGDPVAGSRGRLLLARRFLGQGQHVALTIVPLAGWRSG